MTWQLKRPRPGRRCPMLAMLRPSAYSRLQISLLIYIFVLVSCSPISASDVRPLESSTVAAPTVGSMITEHPTRLLASDQLDRGEEIIQDPLPPRLHPRQLDGLNRRGADGTTSSPSPSTSTPSSHLSSASSSSSTTTMPSSSTTTPSSTRTDSADTSLLLASPTASNNPLPSAFDTSIGSNFTSSSCPAFFHSFLNNATFQSCHPVSLLLQNSNSFFRASHSLDQISQVLQASCDAPATTCTTFMNGLASAIVSSGNCEEDFRLQNPLVTEAHAGFLAYGTLYRASCLKNPKTGNYCFADAITDVSNPADAYVYYLPLGLSLPGSSLPSCSSCLQATMQVFAEAAEVKDQPITVTYLSAAQQINIGCGPSFVSTSVAIGSRKASGAARRWMTVGSQSNLPHTMGYVLLFIAGIIHYGIL